MKVFLGGTVNDSKWRDYLMPKLEIDYFNPVVSEWNDEAYERELYERERCDFSLYVLSPRMEGFYSIAEIIEDSYKKTDKTIFCYLQEDGDKAFAPEQTTAMEKIGQKVRENGSIWKSSLDEVIEFLNSATKRNEGIYYNPDKYYDVFISYGRRHSLAFARKLYNKLNDSSYEVWFDMNDIPLAVDFQEQIDQGIKQADTFLFVISPHSVKSVYCLKEVLLALKYNKRIVPILHVEPNDCWDKMHPEIGKRNWIYFTQQEDFSIPIEEWEYQVDFDNVFVNLCQILNKHQKYVRLHTVLLDKAVQWNQNQRNTRFLLVGQERSVAQEWLLQKTFKDEQGNEVQPPCFPSDLHAEYICEARENAENLMTDVFIGYDRDNVEIKDDILKALMHYNITSWSDTTDIKSGEKFDIAIERGIIGSDNLIFMISPQSVKSEYCIKELELALSYNKRIISILIEETPIQEIPESIHSIEYIDFLDRRKTIETSDNLEETLNRRKEKPPFQKALDKLLAAINTDNSYYRQHKIYLSQAVKWKQQNQNPSILLRGFSLENAKSWLKLSNLKPYKPTQLHRDFITESEAKAGMLDSEVFVSYSRKDSDFARKINEQLQLSGKTTWFDQESIASTADFQEEIYNGIATSNNFLFVISPDSVNSPYCKGEVEHAIQQSKRIVTILHRNTATEKIPPELVSIQWIDFVHIDFHTAFSELVRTLEIDRAYVQRHTKIAQLSKDWNKAREKTIENGQEKNNEELPLANEYLLRGNEFVISEAWLNEAYAIANNEISEKGNIVEDFQPEKYFKLNPKKTPAPTFLQIEFITESKRAIFLNQQKEKEQQEKMLLLEKEKTEAAKKSARLQRILSVFMGIAFLISLFLAIWAYRQRTQISENLKLLGIKNITIDSTLHVVQREKIRSDSLFSEAVRSQRAMAIAKARSDSLFLIANKRKREALKAKSSAESAKNEAYNNYLEALAARKHADSLSYIAEKEKVNALASLKKAQEMQKKMETAVFERAVKDKLKDWKGLKETTENDTIWNKVDTLDLSGNALAGIPEEVAFCKKLKSINLMDNEIEDWQKTFNFLKNMESLNDVKLSLQNMHDIPDELLSKVTGLKIYIDNQSEIPNKIFEQKQLEELIITGKHERNYVSNLPDELFGLTSLKHLEVSYTNITSVPAAIKNLKHLKHLTFYGSVIEQLPPEIGELSRLEKLEMAYNRLSKIPFDISKLKQLNYLDIGNNNFGSIPSGILEIPNLKSLIMNHNQLKGIPDKFWKNDNLTKLIINNNQITEISPKIKYSKNLKDLNIKENLIDTLPDELFDDLWLNASVYDEIGLEYYAKNKYVLAKKAFEKHSEIEPQNKRAVGNAGLAYYVLNDYETAKERLIKSLELDPDYQWAKDVIQYILNDYSDGKQYENAYKLTKQLLLINPNDVDLLYGISFYCLFVSEYDMAEKSALKTLELAPEQTGVNTNLALAYLLKDDYEKAESIYLKWKGKKFTPDDEKIADYYFLADIKELEDTGVKHKDFKRVKALFANQ